MCVCVLFVNLYSHSQYSKFSHVGKHGPSFGVVLWGPRVCLPVWPAVARTQSQGFLFFFVVFFSR